MGGMGWAPGSKDAAVQDAGEALQEGQAHGHVAGILLEEQHRGAPPDDALPPPARVQEPSVQARAIACCDFHILSSSSAC